MKKAIFNWSGGKDSAMALYLVLQDSSFEIKHLLTSLNEEFQRITLHGVRHELLLKQVEEIGIPLTTLWLPEAPSMEDYAKLMEETLEPLVNEGAELSIFGDIFLEDLRKYRDENLAKMELTGVYPLWKRNTEELIREFIDLGFKTILVCVDGSKLDKSFAGRVLDHQCVDEILALGDVDPCGENGEFHTYVYDGPIFKKPIPIQVGETISREYTHGSLSYEYFFTDITL